MMAIAKDIKVADWPSIGKFQFWLNWNTTATSRIFTYHYGFLALDKGQWLPGRTLGGIPGGERWVPCEEVTEIAALAWTAYEAGQVVLVQRKFEPLWYQYIAIRARGKDGRMVQ